jgi:hypothetical protein
MTKEDHRSPYHLLTMRASRVARALLRSSVRAGALARSPLMLAQRRQVKRRGVTVARCARA